MSEWRVARPGDRRRHPRTRLSRGRVLLVSVLLALLLAGAGSALWRQLGYRVYVVHTGSMTPHYRPGDVVVDRRPDGRYVPGEVITFRHSDRAKDVVTHRVATVTPQGLLETKGDANATADAWRIRPDQVRGEASGRIPALGYLIVYLRQPAGIASLASGVVLIVLLWRIFFPADGPFRRPVDHAA